MKFFNLLRFDFVNGIIKQYKKFILITLLILTACVGFHELLQSFELTGASYGDFLLYIYGGIKEYIPSPNERFPIPYLWLLWHMAILYFTLHYMYDDLTGFGQHLIYRCPNRKIWWFSKCVWNISFVVLCYILGFAAAAIFVWSSHGKMTFEISSFMPQLLNFGNFTVFNGEQNLTAHLTILPLLVSIAVSLLQMTVSLLVKPTLSYIVSCIIFISSAYCFSPFFIGNYAMAVRSNLIIGNGMNCLAGIIFSIGISITGIVVGSYIFGRYPILNNKEMS